METETNRSGTNVIEIEPGLSADVASALGELDVAHCLQCGVCSGSCPTMKHMQHGPRRIMHMLRLGVVDPVLASDDIWMCVSCYLCAARCPQGIRITDVMAALRNLALSRGVATDKEATFSRIFVDIVERHGRMSELEVMKRYYTSEAGLTALGGLVRQAGMGLTMFRKGKIPLRAEQIEGISELEEIAARFGGGEDN